MSVISDFCAALTSIFESRGRTTEFKLKQKMLEKRDKQFHKKQWMRLFCGNDFDFVSYLTTFVETNNWSSVPDYLESEKFMDEKIYFCGENIPLFQHRESSTNEDIVRINPILYDKFCGNYHKFQKEVQSNENPSSRNASE